MAANFHNIQTNMDLLWNERFWFPEGVTWEDLRNVDPNVYIPQIEDIGLLSIFIGLVLLIIRFLSERFYFEFPQNIYLNASVSWQILTFSFSVDLFGWSVFFIF